MHDEQTVSQDRLAAVEKLFMESHAEIRSRLLTDVFLIPVTALDIYPVLDGLAKRLRQYDGPIDEMSFTAWAVSATIEGARVAALHRQFSRAVLKGVWKVLKGATDLAGDNKLDKLAQDLADTAWTDFVLKDKLSQLTHGEKLVTWFRNLGFNTARAWKTTQRRTRDRAADVEQADLEALPYKGRVAPKRASEGPTWDQALTRRIAGLAIRA